MSANLHQKLRLLSGGIAHEVSNFMNALSLARQLMRQQIDDSDAIQSLDNLSDLERQMDELTSRLDLLCLPEEERYRPVDLHTSVSNIVSALDDELDGDLSGPGPADDASIQVEVDEEALRHALRELVENAHRCGDDGSIQINVQIQEDQGRISVRDQGSGMPDDLTGDPLDPFVTSSDERTGLGLTIVDQIASGHGGSVSIDSSPSGTNVTVSLPRINSSDA